MCMTEYRHVNDAYRHVNDAVLNNSEPLAKPEWASTTASIDSLRHNTSFDCSRILCSLHFGHGADLAQGADLSLSTLRIYWSAEALQLLGVILITAFSNQ